MGKVAKCQVLSSLLCFAVLVPCLIFTCFLGFGHFSFIVTIPILILSTAFLVILSKKQKQNACVDENSVQENPICDPTRNFVDSEPEERPKPVTTTISPNIETAQEIEVVGLTNEPEDFPSDGESIDDSVSSENFELDWMRCNNVGGQNEVISSTDSISEDDDDSLIEIAIPGSGSTCHSSEEPKKKLHSNLLDCLPESFIRQQGLMELLADTNEVINEEENLIEIDISMGSIKSRFEIES